MSDRQVGVFCICCISWFIIVLQLRIAAQWRYWLCYLLRSADSQIPLSGVFLLLYFLFTWTNHVVLLGIPLSGHLWVDFQHLHTPWYQCHQFKPWPDMAFSTFQTVQGEYMQSRMLLSYPFFHVLFKPSLAACSFLFLLLLSSHHTNFFFKFLLPPLNLHVLSYLKSEKKTKGGGREYPFLLMFSFPFYCIFV